MRSCSLRKYKRETIACNVTHRRIIEEIPFALSHDKTKGMVKIYYMN